MLKASAKSSMLRPCPAFSRFVMRRSMFLAGGSTAICALVSGPRLRDARNALTALSCASRSPRPIVRPVFGARSLMPSPSISQPQFADRGEPLMKRPMPLTWIPAGNATDAEIARLWRESVGLYDHSSERPVVLNRLTDSRWKARVPEMQTPEQPSRIARDSVYDTCRLFAPRTRCRNCISSASYQLLVCGSPLMTTRPSEGTGRGFAALTAPVAGRFLSSPL